MAVISGEIFFSHIHQSFHDARIYVRVEDCNIVGDASPTIIAEQVIPGVSRNLEDLDPVHFAFDSIFQRENIQYQLTVHVDTNGSGTITTGDYISMETIPIPEKVTSLRVVVQLV